jgi:MYXO-CTERM domain-containing protein
MVDCVKDLYSPFDVIVTDIDPGPDTPHFEAMVSGGPADIGMQQGVGGVSPFSCGVIENAITYTFPEAVGNQPQIICEIVGQESAHAFGLDHEYLCEDPMTYLNGCGNKSFRDIDADCGEFSPRNCQCGGATQNSVQRIKAIFGDAIPPTPPEVSIESPSNSSVVRPGFTIVVEATDDVEVKRVEVLIDGDSIGARTEPPYEFSAPGDLFTANVEIEARAFDDRGTMGTDTVSVTVGDPCSSTNECGTGEACVDGRCVPFEVDGGLGEECTSDADCASGICVEELGVCTELCDPAADGCPFGFDCTEVAGGGGACFRGEGDGGDCGCRVGGHSKLPMAPLALLALFFVIRRRRAR